jgi:hypothetical protein
VCGSAASGNWEPSQDHGEKENQDWAEREIGDGETEQSEQADGVVDAAAAALGGPQAGGNADAGADDQRERGELQGGGIVFEDQARDGALEANGLTEIAVGEAAEIANVLHADRGVEAEGVAELLEIFGAGAFAQHLLDGIAGDDVGEEKHHGQDQPNGGKSEKEAEAK